MEVEGVEPEVPIPSSVKEGKQTKKQKREEKGTASEPSKTKSKENGSLNQPEEDPEALRKAKAEKKREEKERKKAKEEAKAMKAKAKKERKPQEATLEEYSEAATQVPNTSDKEDDDDAQGGEIDHIDMEGILEESRDHPSSTATPSTARSPPSTLPQTTRAHPPSPLSPLPQPKNLNPKASPNLKRTLSPQTRSLRTQSPPSPTHRRPPKVPPRRRP